MDGLRKKVLVAVLGFWFIGLGLTFASSTSIIPAGFTMPWPLHVAAWGVLGWLFGPIFWEGLTRGGPSQRNGGEGS